MHTLWLYGALVDEITHLMEKMQEAGIGCVLLMDVFILSSTLTVMNMLVGVLCEVVSATAENETTKNAVNQVNDVLTTFFDKIDKDGNRRISRSEWKEMVDNNDVLKALQGLGIEENHIDVVANVIFATEKDGDERELEFDEFMEQLLHHKPMDNASVLDVMHLGKKVRGESVKLKQKVDQLMMDLEAKRDCVSKGPPLPRSRQKVEYLQNELDFPFHQV